MIEYVSKTKTDEMEVMNVPNKSPVIEIDKNVPFAITICRKVFHDDEVDCDVYVDGVMSVVSAFSESIQKVLWMRCYENKTLREVGEEFQLSHERIRQIEQKIFRKLKHPSRTQKMRVSQFLSQIDILKNELAKAKSEHQVTINRCKAIESMLPKERLEQLDEETKNVKIYSTPTVELDISPRLYNCLARANIENIAGILELKSFEDIMAIKHLGKKSAYELISVMEKIGFTEWVNDVKTTLSL